MTFGTVLLALAFVVFLFLMMKKGGGCCGGHGQHKPTKKDGGCCAANAPQEPHDQHHELESSASGGGKDPVCGMTVASSSLVSEHQGKSYYFCSEHCQKSFAADPGKYI